MPVESGPKRLLAKTRPPSQQGVSMIESKPTSAFAHDEEDAGSLHGGSDDEKPKASANTTPAPAGDGPKVAATPVVKKVIVKRKPV